MVHTGADADVTVVEYHTSTDVAALSVPVVELDVGDAGRLHYLNVQQLGPRVWQIAYQASRVGRDATLDCVVGGTRRRLRPRPHRLPRLVGRGATGNLLAVYFGDGDQMLDFRTFQDHVAPDTTSDLLFKGAVGDNAGRCTPGLIRVRKEARGTNAFQTNRNIKLSEDAWAESVPNLEIENNDVRCSHASTVGPIDEEQRFYLESRGVPPDVAERLIVLGFFDEVLERAARARASAAQLRRRRSSAKLDRQAALMPSAAPVPRRRLAAGDGPALRRRRPPHRRGAHRRRLLRHRRHAARHADDLAVRGRGLRPRSARSSAGSTAARSRSSTASRSRCPATRPVPVYDVDRRGRRRAW